MKNKISSSYFFCNEWAKNVAKFETGEFCIYKLEKNKEICYFQYIKRDISNELTFLETGKYFDIITPFDYGGFYYSSNKILESFLRKFEIKCEEENIISGFFRFNPLLKQDYDILKKYINIVKIQDHIVIPLGKDYQKEFSKRKMRNINKSSKYAYNFLINDNINNFYEVYNSSMKRVDANKYFFFDKNTLNNLLHFGSIFSIEFQNKVVSSIFVLEDKDNIYYFLGGTMSEYLHYGFNSLLFDLVCKYYNSSKKRFLLGGGKNGLYQYKKEFSTTTTPFYIGKKIFNKKVYNTLVDDIKQNNNEFFPKYREKII